MEQQNQDDRKELLEKFGWKGHSESITVDKAVIEEIIEKFDEKITLEEFMSRV